MPAVILSAIGAAGGIMLALWVAQGLRSFLWGVSPLDPLTFVGVAVGLLAVATLASVHPALRVLRLDPVASLRAE